LYIINFPPTEAFFEAFDIIFYYVTKKSFRAFISFIKKKSNSNLPRQKRTLFKVLQKDCDTHNGVCVRVCEICLVIDMINSHKI